MLETILQIDGNILLWIQDTLRSDFLTPFVKGVTSLGNSGIIWIILAIVLLIPKKTRTIGVLVGLALLGSLIVNNVILKNLVARTRPYEVIEGLQCLVKAQRDFSFPSGHTGSSFAAAVVMFKGLPKKLGIPAMILAVMIALSRLYVGVHYPTDVIAGAITGTLIAIIVWWSYKKITKLGF